MVDPQISPDGQRVAFVVATASEELDDFAFVSNRGAKEKPHLHVVPADGGDRLRRRLRAFSRRGTRFGRVGRPRQRLERWRIILDWFAKYRRPET